jgi:hypothetical protein
MMLPAPAPPAAACTLLTVHVLARLVLTPLSHILASPPPLLSLPPTCAPQLFLGSSRAAPPSASPAAASCLFTGLLARSLHAPGLPATLLGSAVHYPAAPRTHTAPGPAAQLPACAPSLALPAPLGSGACTSPNACHSCLQSVTLLTHLRGRWMLPVRRQHFTQQGRSTREQHASRGFADCCACKVPGRA